MSGPCNTCLHNQVARYTLEQRGGWALQPALAKVVANVTGVGRPKDFTGRKDWGAAGNFMQRILQESGHQLTDTGVPAAV